MNSFHLTNYLTVSRDTERYVEETRVGEVYCRSEYIVSLYFSNQ